MANMSYCRFENTLTDLQDCVKAIEEVVYDDQEISKREWEFAESMRSWCEMFLEVMYYADKGKIKIID